MADEAEVQTPPEGEQPPIQVEATAAGEKPAEGKQEASAPVLDKDGKPVGAEKAPEAKPASDPAARQFAALSRKEKALVAKEREIKALEAEIQKKHSSVEAYDKAIAAAKRDPFRFMKDQLGLSWEQLVELQVNPESAALSEVDRRLEEFKAEQTRAQETERAAAAARNQELIAQAEASVVAMVNAHADEYELTVLYGVQHQVPELIRGWYDAKHELLTDRQAAQMVEEQLRKEADKIEKTKYWSTRSKPQDQQGVAAKEEKGAPAQRTLTNKLTPTTAAAEQSQEQSTVEEKTARAKAKLKALRAEAKA